MTRTGAAAEGTEVLRGAARGRATAPASQLRKPSCFHGPEGSLTGKAVCSRSLRECPVPGVAAASLSSLGLEAPTQSQEPRVTR